MKKNIKWIRLAILITSWMTVPLLGKKTFWRFFPAASFITLLLSLESEVSRGRNWWKIKGYKTKGRTLSIPFVYGPFMVGSIWILKWTYGHFFRYLFVNVVMDSFFSFVVSPIVERIGFYRLKKFTRPTIFWNFIIFSLIMYSYQLKMEKNIVSVSENK
ncbi:hypothetical protein [Alkalihalobacillus sp. AL-G]|uniref:hypothetical protein n=1 Tax=Alkalihalobacillus sp. AL-G TaxID=2926399 RepID=UPI00272A81E5|nr:hypothetical protein [Alkalihalobacillus sp. AL-G]WLD91682.1 hypothetical protein MOJ78_11570 [Alkalihalobacillus sp. AL-G]